jgi:hypothetical protein
MQDTFPSWHLQLWQCYYQIVVGRRIMAVLLLAEQMVEN